MSVVLTSFIHGIPCYRTLKLRALQQSQTATALVAWLNQAAGGKEHDGIPANTVHSVLHASLQKVTWDIKAQFPGGFGATFSILVIMAGNGDLLYIELSSINLFCIRTALADIQEGG